MANIEQDGPRHPQDWAIEFIRNEPWYIDSASGSPKYFGYWNDFFLDISDIERRAEKYASTPDQNLSIPHGVGIEELRKYADKLLAIRIEAEP